MTSVTRVGTCEREGCEERFVDTSYARTRRFCSDYCRKVQHAGNPRCEECGVALSWGGGARGIPTRCPQHPELIWTRETVVAAIQSFAREVGRPPAAADFNAAHARQLGHVERAKRFVDKAGDWPNAASVLDVFGTWADAIEAAGFPRPSVGRYDRTIDRAA